MKKLIRLALVLVVVLIAALVGVYLYLDTIARNAVERGATGALGVETSVGGMHVQVLRGSVDMSNLKVANPQGFKTDHFLKMKDGDLAVSLGTLMQDKVVVSHVKLTDIDINLEQLGDKANYQAILENLNKQESGKEPPPEAAKSNPKKFVITDVTITNIVVHAQQVPMGSTTIPMKLDVVIPEIQLHNVGSDSDKGVLMSELSGIIVKAVLTAISQKTGGILPPEMLVGLNVGLSQLKSVSNLGVKVVGDVTSQVGNVTKAIGDVGQEVGKIGEQGGKAVQDIGKVGEGLGGLLGGKKKDEKGK